MSQTGSGYIAVTHSKIGARMGWVFITNLRPLYPQDKTRLPTIQKAGSANGPDGRTGRGTEIIDSNGIRNPDIRDRTDWL
jgi:hypothetical protein